MSYGKFGMKMRYNPYVSPQEQLGESLGSVLGTIWGENYNRRGIEKGEQEALKALYGEGESSGAIGGGSNGGSNNVPQELYQQAVGSGAIGASGKSLRRTKSPMRNGVFCLLSTAAAQITRTVIRKSSDRPPALSAAIFLAFLEDNCRLLILRLCRILSKRSYVRTVEPIIRFSRL